MPVLKNDEELKELIFEQNSKLKTIFSNLIEEEKSEHSKNKKSYSDYTIEKEIYVKPKKPKVKFWFFTEWFVNEKTK